MVGLFVSGGYTAEWPEYVRADLHAAAVARVAELEAALAEILSCDAIETPLLQSLRRAQEATK